MSFTCYLTWVWCMWGLICSRWDPFGIRVEIPFKPMDLGCTSMSTYQTQFKKYKVDVNNIFVTKVSPRKLCFVLFLYYSCLVVIFSWVWGILKYFLILSLNKVDITCNWCANDFYVVGVRISCYNFNIQQ